jgi:hypothetical protein
MQMEDVINAICNDLVKNSHVIGILTKCECFGPVQNHEKTVYLCVISKEAGNVSTVSQMGEFVVHIRWRTDCEFCEWVKSNDLMHSTCKILYDRTGMIGELITQKKVE